MRWEKRIKTWSGTPRDVGHVNVIWRTRSMVSAVEDETLTTRFEPKLRSQLAVDS